MPSTPCRVSAKTGDGVAELLEELVRVIPPPKGDPRGAAAGADHRFLVRQLSRRRIAGARHERHLAKRDKIVIMSIGRAHLVDQVGVFTPKRQPRQSLHAGEVGFVIAGIKDMHGAPVGDTMTHAQQPRA